jgi:PKD repeat protein
MMKMKYPKWLLQMLAIILVVFACDDSSTPTLTKDPIASFQFEKDAADFSKVTFKNFSQNATSYSWNFGDGTAASTEENPVHSFATSGKFTVKLTAKNDAGKTNDKSLEVEINDPNVELKKLTGETSKSWKLLRDVSTGILPMQVGPAARNTIWWSYGGAEEIGARPCMLNDEFVFSLDGTYEYKTNGDFWADAGVWNGDPGCRDDSNENFVNVDGADISAWNKGVHQFEFKPADKTLKVIGTGAFVALAKAATNDQVKTPQESVTYNVVKLVDATVDTLVLETTFGTGDGAGYWRFVLVHYDNANDEPPIPGSKPVAGFSYVLDGHTATFTNTSTGSGTITYAWDFGDNTTSTEQNPVHTYATDGSFDVVLTATNENGDKTATQNITISAAVLTNDVLNGGSSKIWKLRSTPGSFKVGPNKGSGDWYDAQDLASARPCLINDEFIFKTGGVYQYDAQGDIYAEPYMGVANPGCIDEANMPSDAAAWKSGTFAYTFNAASGETPATITLNGLGAFIALPKAHNGGEYASAPPTLDSNTYEVLSYVDDGSVETLTVSMDINGGFWTFVLTHEK